MLNIQHSTFSYMPLQDTAVADPSFWTKLTKHPLFISVVGVLLLLLALSSSTGSSSAS